MMMALMPWHLSLLAVCLALSLGAPAGRPGGRGAQRTQESPTAGMTSGQVIGDSRHGQPPARQKDRVVKDNEGEEPMNDRDSLAAHMISGWGAGDITNGHRRQNNPRTQQNMPALPGMRSPINSHVNEGPVKSNEGEEPINNKGQSTDGNRMAEQRNKREVLGASQPPRRRVRPHQPNCTGCYSSLNLQSDPSTSAEPDASE